MLNINFIRQNPEIVKEVCRAKNISLDIDRLLVLDKQRRELIQKSQALRAQQKKLGKEDREKAKELKVKFKPLAAELSEVEKEYKELMLLTPNIYSEDTPVGPDESYNKEIYHWGKIPKFDFPIKSHIQLGKDLNLIDFERGVKVSGFRGYYLKNEAVLLHFALLWYALLKMVSKGFQPMFPPTILKEFALIGSGHFPFSKEDIYQIANPGKLADGREIKEPLFLAGTSEPSLLAYFSDTILDEKDLPIKICGFSQCYRSEVGSYGKDTKGLYRVHEFMKVEQVVLCKNDIEESEYWFQEMNKISQEILEELKLPYRVVQICTGEMGAGKYKMYDIETWMPSRNSYSETHSNSNLTDWQSRRLNIKYRTKDGQKKYVHALNNTVLASPRILIAILENYQRKDDKINVPKVLQKYLGFKVIPHFPR
jgi:seryl-tRNA synthetase